MVNSTNDYKLRIEIIRKTIIGGKVLNVDVLEGDVVKGEIIKKEIIKGKTVESGVIAERIFEDKKIVEEIHYYAKVLNGGFEIPESKITEEMAIEIFDNFVKQDRNRKRSDERNLDQLELSDENLKGRAINQKKDVEETAWKNWEKDVLYKAIKTLPKIQMRRVILYYYEDLNYEQIAQIEGCSFRAIKYSVDCAKSNIKKFLKEF